MNDGWKIRLNNDEKGKDSESDTKINKMKKIKVEIICAWNKKEKAKDVADMAAVKILINAARALKSDFMNEI